MARDLQNNDLEQQLTFRSDDRKSVDLFKRNLKIAPQRTFSSKHFAYSCTVNLSASIVLTGALTPDHIVYAVSSLYLLILSFWATIG